MAAADSASVWVPCAMMPGWSLPWRTRRRGGYGMVVPLDDGEPLGGVAGDLDRDGRLLLPWPVAGRAVNALVSGSPYSLSTQVVPSAIEVLYCSQSRVPSASQDQSLTKVAVPTGVGKIATGAAAFRILVGGLEQRVQVRGAAGVDVVNWPGDPAQQPLLRVTCSGRRWAARPRTAGARPEPSSRRSAGRPTTVVVAVLFRRVEQVTVLDGHPQCGKIDLWFDMAHARTPVRACAPCRRRRMSSVLVPAGCRAGSAQVMLPSTARICPVM